MTLAPYYRPRPRPAKDAPSKRSPLEGADGLVTLDPIPHETLLTGAKPISLAEQVYNLERLSQLRRKSLMDDMADDDWGEEFDNLSPLSPYEIDGLRDPAPSNPTPQPVSGREEPKVVTLDPSGQ